MIVVTVKNADQDEFDPNNLVITHKGFFIQKNDEFIQKSLVKTVLGVITGSKDKDKQGLSFQIQRIVEDELMKQYEKKPLIIANVI